MYIYTYIRTYAYVCTITDSDIYGRRRGGAREWAGEWLQDVAGMCVMFVCMHAYNVCVYIHLCRYTSQYMYVNVCVCVCVGACKGQFQGGAGPGGQP